MTGDLFTLASDGLDVGGPDDANARQKVQDDIAKMQTDLATSEQDAANVEVGKLAAPTTAAPRLLTERRNVMVITAGVSAVLQPPIAPAAHQGVPLRRVPGSTGPGSLIVILGHPGSGLTAEGQLARIATDVGVGRRAVYGADLRLVRVLAEGLPLRRYFLQQHDDAHGSTVGSLRPGRIRKELELGSGGGTVGPVLAAGWPVGQLWPVCVLGAQLLVLQAGYGTAATVWRARLRIGNELGHLGQPQPVDEWNDQPGRHQADVRRLLERAAGRA